MESWSLLGYLSYLRCFVVGWDRPCHLLNNFINYCPQLSRECPPFASYMLFHNLGGLAVHLFSENVLKEILNIIILHLHFTNMLLAKCEIVTCFFKKNKPQPVVNPDRSGKGILKICLRPIWYLVNWMKISVIGTLEFP